MEKGIPKLGVRVCWIYLDPKEGIPMEGILPELRHSDKEHLLNQLACCSDASRKTRLLIIVNLFHGRSVMTTATVLQVHRSTVYRVAERFREDGESGLCDRRGHNGHRKVTEKYLGILHDVVRASPLDYGWRRPTWTRELLVATLFTKTRIRIHAGTMSIALHQIRARRGRPKPTVHCPWPNSSKNRRLRAIRRLVDRLPTNEVVIYEDEVDIHLNPKIGWDWMVRGQQKEVVTPGKNVKRYLAGALDARTGRLIWVEAERKNSALFVRLLWKLVCHYRRARVIHVILDNYSIHSTSLVELSLDTPAGSKIQLHFLPPYCPDHNKIERVWQDLHANVTRNHRCATIETLMENVRQYLVQRNRTASHTTLAA
jgi:putative transposase